ncbi:MAG: ATP-binding cassette domain-containing protein, partial [Clostridia bacterium]|nr:ATP-binding cassette domain-containing protein [Clostridia bacterium]
MIKMEHLCKSYGDLTVLKDISAEIHKGEIITIIGPSGTGKSTLLRCLNLLEKPSGGSIYINNVDLLAKTTNVPKIRQKMGMV